MNYELVIYTMEGCSHCTEFKKLLEAENIAYHDRDIDKYNEEYDMYSKITKTEFVPFPPGEVLHAPLPVPPPPIVTGKDELGID